MSKDSYVGGGGPGVIEADGLEAESISEIVKASENFEVVQALTELEELDKLRDSRRWKNGMDYYVPNKQQYQAHLCTSRTILYVGGNRAGKSTFGAMELCYHLTRKYPDWYPKEKRFKRTIKAVVSSTKFDIITRVIEPKIFSLLPRDYYTFRRTTLGHLTHISCIDGSTVDILTSEMKDDAYESADWDFVWEDEPQQQSKRQAILRGLVDRRGKEVITFTPLTEPWMKEELVDKADGSHISLFTVDIRDNKFTVDGTPILSEEAIHEFEESLPEDVRDTRIHGKFFYLRGQVYREFAAVHCKDFIYQHPDPVICVIDPHDRLPHHAIWAYIDRQDDIFVDSELIVRCELDDFAIKVKAHEKAHNYKMRKRLIDPNFGRRPSKIGANYTVIEELARNGCGCGEANDNIELRHMITRDYLHWNPTRPESATNKPKLFFHRDRCPITIRSMRNLQYDEWQGKTADNKNPKELEKEKDNHGADCVGYLCVGRPKFHYLIETRDDELSQSPY